jgi:AcrR family transcriptional regulator
MQTERQQEIVRMAMDIVSTEGLSNLTTKNLAKRMGVSEPALYRHFENKVAILAGVLEYFRVNTETVFSQHIVDEMPAFEKIATFFRNNFRSFTENPSFVVVIFSDELYRSEPSLSQAIGAIQQGNRARLLGILEKGQQVGDIRTDVPKEHLALILMSTLRNFVNNWHQSDRSFSLTERGEGLLVSLGKLMKPS